VDHLARESMKSAANCVNYCDLHKDCREIVAEFFSRILHNGGIAGWRR
jgi:tRNA 2-selenouridine synthase SelU